MCLCLFLCSAWGARGSGLREGRRARARRAENLCVGVYLRDVVQDMLDQPPDTPLEFLAR